MSMEYDEEAVYQDADVEMASFEEESRRARALRRRGVCLHSTAVGVSSSGKIFYPEQVGLTGTQQRCTEGCGRVFDSLDDLRAATEEAMGS